MADMQAVKNEVALLEKRLSEQVTRAKRQQTITIGIGVVLILFVIIYFQVIRHFVNQMLEPRDLSNMAVGWVEESIPEVRKFIEETAVEQTPILVDNIINRVIQTEMPNLRRDAVAFVKSETASRLTEFETLLETALDDLVASHKENIEDLIEQLDNQEGKEAFEQEVHEMIIASMDDNEIRETLEVYLLALQDIQERLIRLSSTPEEELLPAEVPVRNIVSIVRAMAEKSTLDVRLLEIESEILKPIESAD